MSLRVQVVDRARELYEDLDLLYVQGWMAENRAKAVGFLPVYVPRELIWASGLLPVGVHGGGDRLEIIRGDAYYQSYICHLPRSIVELLLSGRLDCLSGVLFPSTCDVIRNLSGMWRLLSPETYVRYVDLPQSLDACGEAFFALELRKLLEDLGEISGEPADEPTLRASCDTYNRVRAGIRQVYAMRSKQPWSVPTEELYLLMRAGEVLAPEEYLTLIRGYLRAVELEPGRRRDNCRVVVVGSFCEPPPVGFLKTIERAGCYIVDDELLLGNRMLGDDVPIEGDPVDALAQTFVRSARASSLLFEADPRGKSTLMKKRVEAANADGIIFAAASFCDPALLDRPMLRAGAEAAGIPCIAFKYSENTGQFQQFREQAGTFADAIKLWGAA